MIPPSRYPRMLTGTSRWKYAEGNGDNKSRESGDGRRTEKVNALVSDGSGRSCGVPSN